MSKKRRFLSLKNIIKMFLVFLVLCNNDQAVAQTQFCDKIPIIINGNCMGGAVTLKLPPKITTTSLAVGGSSDEDSSTVPTTTLDADSSNENVVERLAKLATTRSRSQLISSTLPTTTTTTTTATKLPKTKTTGKVGSNNSAGKSFAQLTCACNDGYQLIGIRNVRCLGHNKWTPLPICRQSLSSSANSRNQMLSCGPVPVVPNASCRQSISPNSNNNQIITTQATNYDESSDPRRSDVEEIAGPVITAYKTNDMFTCRCRDGYYQLSSSSSLICMANGEWSNVPICVSLQSTAIIVTTPDPTNNIYCVPPEVENSDCYETADDGMTETRLLTSLIGTGTLQQDAFIPSGKTIKYTCKSGFRMTGSPYVTCSSFGTWSQLPKCNPSMSATCDGLPRIIGGRCVTAVVGKSHSSQYYTFYRQGEQAKCWCDRDKIMITGLPVVTCGSGGRWNDLPTCTLRPMTTSRVTCSSPPKVNGAGCDCPDDDQQDSTIFYSGDTIRYTCKVGYTLQGNPVIACQDDGTWSQLPNCVRFPSSGYNNGGRSSDYNSGRSSSSFQQQTTGCPPPRRVANAYCPCHTSNFQGIQFQVGDQVRFTCNSGYRINGGSGIVTCLRDSTWFGYPTCQPFY